MLRNGRTGHTWHLVVDHIMLVMKMRSSSPVNRLVGLYRGFMYMYKKTKQKKNKKKKKLCKSVTLLIISLYGINVLNDYMRFFTVLYCESLI